MITGAVLGLAVYGIMNYVVIPLAPIGVVPRPPAAIWITGVLVHMFGIGWPIAAVARRGLLAGARH